MKNFISKEIEFDMGHRVSTHGSKCKNPHGHRYKVRVTCEGHIIDDPSRSDHGMLIDFGNLKGVMNNKIHDVLDHAFVIWEQDQVTWDAMDGHGWLLVKFPLLPTAENIARWAWEQIVYEIEYLFGNDLKLYEVAVWETPTSVAYHRGEK